MAQRHESRTAIASDLSSSVRSLTDGLPRNRTKALVQLILFVNGRTGKYLEKLREEGLMRLVRHHVQHETL
jgi:hypothetical protein